MGVSEDLAETFADNHNFDPETETRVVVALQGLEGVEGRTDVLGRVALIATATQAAKARDWVELLAAYHAEITPAKKIVIASSAPFLVDAQGRAHAVFPTDYITTDPVIEAGITRASQALVAMGLKLGPFYATGRIDPKMVAKLRAAGWSEVHERAGKLLRKD
jgi:hypothetical protein